MVWEKQFDGKFWLYPILEEIAHFNIQKKIKKISGKESNYIVQYITRRNNKEEFYNFRHLVGIKEDAKYYYELYLNKSFLNKLRKLFLNYQNKEFKLRKTLYKKKGFGFYHFKNIYEEGFLLSKFTDPSLLVNIENKLKEIFKTKLNNNQKIFGDLNQFSKLSIIKREELEILKLALLLKNNENNKNNIENFKEIRNKIDKKLSEIQYNFGFLQYVEGNKIISKEIYLNKAKSFLKNSKIEIKNQIKNIESFEKDQNKLRNKYFKKFKLNKLEKNLFNINAELAYIRLELRKLWIPYYCEMVNSLENLAKSNNININKLDSLNSNEFENFLFSGNVKKVKRVHTILMFKEKENIEFFYNKEAEEVAKKFEIPLGFPKTNKLNGEIANNGFVKGKVKVLHWQKGYEKEMDNMNEGDILVVTQTKPDMLKAIRKASGIVTNEGGMISHAAIIARELGIPCLINTKYATEIFKEGDNVILDCNKGEVLKNDN